MLKTLFNIKIEAILVAKSKTEPKVWVNLILALPASRLRRAPPGAAEQRKIPKNTASITFDWRIIL